MAQPAPVPSFEQGLRPFVEDAPSNPAAFLDGGPANRAISELTLALGGGVAKDECSAFCSKASIPGDYG